MKLAVMQPYFLPYIGYFQLIAAVDKFVVFDDVNFINRGWVNRNRILMDARESLITIPLQGASQNRLINEIEVANDLHWRRKLSRTVEQAYRSAPYYSEICSLVSDIIHFPQRNLACFLVHGIEAVNAYLGIESEVIQTSSIYGNSSLKGEERILDICRREHASTYINLPGGRGLYRPEKFDAAGVELLFINPEIREYKQRSPVFKPWLSIIDVLMYNDKNATAEMLNAMDMS